MQKPPISGNILLISIDGKPLETISPEFIVQFGASIIKRATRFVACQNKRYLQSLIEYYKLNTRINNQERIIDDLFCMLEEKT